MNVLVIGCGLLGRKIARTMDEMGWDVSVLSNIESDLELLENDFEGVTFRGSRWIFATCAKRALKAATRWR